VAELPETLTCSLDLRTIDPDARDVIGLIKNNDPHHCHQEDKLERAGLLPTKFLFYSRHFPGFWGQRVLKPQKYSKGDPLFWLSYCNCRPEPLSLVAENPPTGPIKVSTKGTTITVTYARPLLAVPALPAPGKPTAEEAKKP
jgi:hypothetical protein